MSKVNNKLVKNKQSTLLCTTGKHEPAAQDVNI